MAEHDEDKAAYYAALRRRSVSLARLMMIENESVKRVPAPIIVMHVKLLLMSALGYCGAELREWWLGWLDHKIREDHGLCGYCGRRKQDTREPLCETCMGEIDQEDRLAEEASLMERKTGGVM